MKINRHLFSVVFVVSMLSMLLIWSHQQVSRLLSRQNSKLISAEPPPAESLKLCALGYDQLLADFYWLSFVQYLGDREHREKDKFALASKYLDVIVGLDPKFVKAYWFASFIIGSEQHNPEQADLFIERGIAANPNNWYLPFIAGINQYLYARNDAAAAKYYRMASKFPDAPVWLGRQAHILDAKIPSLIKEVNTWTNIYNTSSDSIIRDKARYVLIGLWNRVLETAPTKIIQDRARSAIEDLKSDR